MQIPKRKPGKWATVEPDRYLTAEKLARLQAELAAIEGGELRKAADEVRRTSEMGDRSENAAYTEARARLTRLHNRILSLKERIKSALVIEKGPDPSGRVRLGSTVVVEMNGRSKTYEILGVQETDPSKGRISHLSPLGAALLGKKAGDSARLEIGGRETAVRVIEVR